ncbi:CRISPR-associated DxTHG motif protein [Thermosulfurimonas marina]|uniref:CRISPR-associated DxTHG motif protein n=1 Tax=Thermosulfurimonas marina TaxID=2047767 RepID=UPI003CCDD6BE
MEVWEGRSEEEIRDNFRKVIENLSEGEEVFFDITHSFRSLPMLNLVALSYARVLKGIRIRGIYYGAFEVLGSPKKSGKSPGGATGGPGF